ncbi:la-related protein 7 [Cylas formicarius]|uniref:la-related protein 7 n=1 Tax=Cylas formicarius TaxID=197179 RepID=UPI002958A32A|nr:la-related protein 7 [Cylas formicarius]XP_060520488.1 la-related protein 7 [Cylas formicarius]
MGEGECENVNDEVPKQPRHRKKHFYNTILNQMEFYFSDSNLSKDRFLSHLLSENNHVDIDLFFKFNKIRKLNCTVEDIRKAIKKSEIIELSEDGQKIGRKKPVKVKDNVDACTIYVENIKSDANHEWLRQVFSEFGQVTYVSIPKYKHNRVNKGFAFIEYETEREANEALSFFESVGLKMPCDKDPEQLRSIATFEDHAQEKNATPLASEPTVSDSSKKRKISDSEEEELTKKAKLEIEEQHSDDGNKQIDVKKKKKNKKDKKKNHIKELGMQVLSKREWKRLRNRYLDLQRKKMRDFKHYLQKQKFTQKLNDRNKTVDTSGETSDACQISSALNFVPGVIVKFKLQDPCVDVRKLKTEIKTLAPDLKYIDIPKPGCQDWYVRFGDSEAAKEFCTKEFGEEKVVLTDQEEASYWEKIQGDRTIKLEKQNKKQRGRDKLMRRAERESLKHIRFEEPE